MGGGGSKTIFGEGFYGMFSPPLSMGDSHGDPQTSPHHADPNGLGACLNKKPYRKSMWIGVLWAGLRAAMWVTHVGGPWPARKVTESFEAIF